MTTLSQLANRKKSGILRELKSRKRKFGFQCGGLYSAENFIDFGEAIKRGQWIDPELLIDVNYSGGSGIFNIYTDVEAAANELRANFC